MIGIESIKYSLNNLRKRKLRSFLTILSIFIGIATIFVFISFGIGLYDYVNGFTTGTSVDKVVVQARGIGAPGLDDTFKLDESDLKAVRKSAGVYEATGTYIKIAEVEFKKEKKFVFLSGYDPKKPLIRELFNAKIMKGRDLEPGDQNVAVLGYSYTIKNKVFSKPLQVGDKIKIQGKKIRIVGFYEPVGNPQDDSNIYVTESSIDVLYPPENNSNFYGWIIARVDPSQIDKTISNIERNLRKSRGLKEGEEDFFVQSFQDLIESYSKALNIIVGFIVLIAFISVLVSVINTANTMITSVLERVREIGVIKAVGAKNSEIFGIFLFESSFLGLVAGVIGVAIGWGSAYIGGTILKNLGWGFLSPAFPPYLFGGLILFAIITGAISGVIPAMRASKINVSDALRYE